MRAPQADDAEAGSGSVVALKTLSRVDAAGIYRLKNEFRSLAELSHRGLVRLRELHADGERWFFTMDLVEGVPRWLVDVCFTFTRSAFTLNVVQSDARILRMLARKASISTSEVAQRLDVSRQAAHRRLQRLAAAGHVIHHGAGRAARWAAAGGDKVFRFRTAGLEEDRVWTMAERTVPLLTVLNDDARSIARYAFTELLNNAIEHSRSKTVEVRFGGRQRVVWFDVIDFGVGVFENVRRQRKLRTALDAPAELSKGKVTTDPEHHSGEGIFFTSKAVSRFELESNGVLWVVDSERNDQTLQSSTRRRGTRAHCEVAKKPRKRLQQVFDEYTIDLEFARTRTVVRLFARGVEFVSRSEARRLVQGLEKFREVVLDFDRVRSIGQGFADEIFRVWADAHSDIELIPVNTVPEVQFLIERARRSTA